MALALTLANSAIAAGASSTLHRLAQRSYERGDFARTIELLRDGEGDERSASDDPDLLYLKAQAHAQLGESDAAGRALIQAVNSGFRDFPAMRRDPALASLKEHPAYQAIIAAADEAATELAQRSLDAWLERFDRSDYRVEHDEQRRLIYVTALDGRSQRAMRDRLERQADHLVETLFEQLPNYDVLIAIPTPRDARSLFQRENVGGSYEHRHRRLVSRNTGFSLRHEFFHVLHYGHMEVLGQSHRLWVQEGMAALYEDYHLSEDGTIVFLPNDRNEIVRNRARVNRLVPWQSIFELSSQRFMARATVLYPQARSMFEFVAAQGKLQDWYRAYVAHFDEDPTGQRAFEIAFAQPVAEIEQQWRTWVGESVAPGADAVKAQPQRTPSLGIGTRPHSASDGVLVTQILPGSTASHGELRVGDVVMGIDDRQISTLEDLIREVRSRGVGERVQVRIRRGDDYSVLPMVLRALGEDP